MYIYISYVYVYAYIYIYTRFSETRAMFRMDIGVDVGSWPLLQSLLRIRVLNLSALLIDSMWGEVGNIQVASLVGTGFVTRFHLVYKVFF